MVVRWDTTTIGQSEAFHILKDMFTDLGYDWQIVDDLEANAPGGVEPSGLRIFKNPPLESRATSKPTYLVLDLGWKNKEAFLELFSLGKFNIWEIKDPDNLIERGYDNNSLEAQIFTLDMGRTYEKLNGKFHIGSGYLAVYPDGFSNMILLEWFEGDASGIKGPKWVEGIGGELLYGENAYQRLLELRTSEWSFYPSINRTVIP